MHFEVRTDGLMDQPLLRNDDDGSPFKGATLAEALSSLKITPSCFLLRGKQQ